MLMWIARLEEDVNRAENLAEEVRAGICELVSYSPPHGHARAMVLSGLAAHEVWRGRLESAATLLGEAYPVAVATRDMPVVSSVGLTVAAFAEGTGDDATAAEMLGAAAALRGSDDATDLTVRQLTASLRSSLGERFERAYATGRALAKDDALARLDPASYIVAAATG
jgi:hypothetical protein